MSRYTKQVDNLLFAWGYDEPLQEYFFSCEDLNLEEDELIFSIANHITIKPHPSFPDHYNYSNSEILEVMEMYDDVVPEEHRMAIVNDLKF